MKCRLDKLEAAGRLSFIKISKEMGPIFKGQAWGGFWVYVIGLPLCRKIIEDHEDDLQPVTLETTSLFATGLLRQMEGDTHRQYRTQLVQALTSTNPHEAFDVMTLETKGHLADLAATFESAQIPFSDLKESIATVVLNELFRFVFGIDPLSKRGTELREAYQELGGNGLVWTVGVRQKRAFSRISSLVQESLTETACEGTGSLLRTMQSQGQIDPTMIGNLIYMVEMGRYDTTAFFRWLIWFIAMNPRWADRIADEVNGSLVSEAFVREALRLEQSERLVRRVKRSFVAGGYLFPKGASVRFCIWEAHKDPTAHNRPFSFDPERFLNMKPNADRYSPFGIGKHQCPFGTFSIKFGAAFVRSITKLYKVSAEQMGSPVRGLYHWEPDDVFSPVLIPRSTDAVT